MCTEMREKKAIISGFNRHVLLSHKLEYKWMTFCVRAVFVLLIRFFLISKAIPSCLRYMRRVLSEESLKMAVLAFFLLK